MSLLRGPHRRNFCWLPFCIAESSFHHQFRLEREVEEGNITFSLSFLRALYRFSCFRLLLRHVERVKIFIAKLSMLECFL
jgi:hypothetical protein